jgi:general secretion pathway protein D
MTAAAPGGAPTLPPVMAAPAAGQPGEPGGQIAPGAPATGTNALEETIPPGTIDFRAADLNQVLQIYSELRNRTLLRPGNLGAVQITLKTQTALTRREAIQALEAVLGLNGVATVDFGEKFVKVIMSPQAGNAGGEPSAKSAEQLPEIGQFVTHVVQVTNVRPTELVQVLQPFASVGAAGGILAIDSSQVLVLRDFTENVKRMLEMIKKVDVALPTEFVSEVIPIKYAKASEIASALTSLSGGGGGAAVGSTTGTPSTRSTRSLGVRGAGGVMGSIPGGAATPLGGVPATTPAAAAGGAQSSFAQRVQNLVARASGDIEVIGRTKMIADERTNSLLVFATRDDMKMIKEVIGKLDVVLAQVLIEAVIMQVSLNKSQDLGISYLQHNIQNASGDVGGAGIINNGTLFNRDIRNQIGTITNTLVRSGFSYMASLGNDLDVTVTALAANSRAKVLQRPRIQTSHNEPAHLFVGESRPYPTSSYYGGGAYGGYSSIQQLPIGVSLDVTPLINPDGLVVMEIVQDIESVAGTVAIANVGDVPITSQKNASTKVSVRDRDTIMLGGLIESSKTKNNSGVPLLKDIPGLGFLFRSNSETEDRSELIVLIRPTVLPTPEVAAMAARNEQNNMPLIKVYEKELQAQEEGLLKQSAQKEETLYTCGTHPEVIQDKPGNCPICGMKLTAVSKQANGAASRNPK